MDWIGGRAVEEEPSGRSGWRGRRERVNSWRGHGDEVRDARRDLAPCDLVKVCRNRNSLMTPSHYYCPPVEVHEDAPW